MSEQINKPPVWFWVVAVLAVLWNLLGLMAFFLDPSINPESLEGMTQTERDGYAARPSWAFGAFAIAVISGTVGSILLVLKKALASPILLLSLLAVLVQNFYMFAIAGMHRTLGMGALTLPIMVLLVAIFLVWFARFCSHRNWLS